MAFIVLVLNGSLLGNRDPLTWNTIFGIRHEVCRNNNQWAIISLAKVVWVTWFGSTISLQIQFRWLAICLTLIRFTLEIVCISRAILLSPDIGLCLWAVGVGLIHFKRLYFSLVYNFAYPRNSYYLDLSFLAHVLNIIKLFW